MIYIAILINSASDKYENAIVIMSPKGPRMRMIAPAL